MNTDSSISGATIAGPDKSPVGSAHEAIPMVMRVKDLSADERQLQARYWGVCHDNEIVRCSVCSKPGHMRETCSARNCARCGLEDSHFPQDCLQRQKCSRCRERGHDAALCQSKLKRSSAEGLDCDFCGGNHLEDTCSWLWRTFNPQALETNELVYVNRLPIGCYECGSTAHFGDDCSALPAYKAQKSTNNIFSAEFANRFLKVPRQDEVSIKGLAQNSLDSSKQVLDPWTLVKQPSVRATPGSSANATFAMQKQSYRSVPPPENLAMGTQLQSNKRLRRRNPNEKMNATTHPRYPSNQDAAINTNAKGRDRFRNTFNDRNAAYGV